MHYLVYVVVEAKDEAAPGPQTHPAKALASLDLYIPCHGNSFHPMPNVPSAAHARLVIRRQYLV